MKIFISADMEGISAVVAREECSSADKDYPQWRKTMTLDVNSAIEGALEAGATEILVNDSHGGGRNIMPDILHPAAVISRGQPLPSMIAPLDKSYTAVLLVGYHAMRGTACAILDHTYTMKYHWIKLNGREFGELGMAAAYAGHFNVPVAFVSGDDKLEAEARAFIPEATAAVVKFAMGQTTARCFSPKKSREKIRAGVREALSRVDRLKPFVVEPPLELEIRFESAATADQAICLPGVERLDGRTIRRVFDAMPDVSRFISILTRVTS